MHGELDFPWHWLEWRSIAAMRRSLNNLSGHDSFEARLDRAALIDRHPVQPPSHNHLCCLPGPGDSVV